MAAMSGKFAKSGNYVSWINEDTKLPRKIHNWEEVCNEFQDGEVVMVYCCSRNVQSAPDKFKAFAEENSDKRCLFFCVAYKDVNIDLDQETCAGQCPKWFVCKKDQRSNVVIVGNAQEGNDFEKALELIE